MMMFSKNSLRSLRNWLKSWTPALCWMYMIFSGSGDSNSMARSSRIIEPLLRWLFANITPDQIYNVNIVVRKGAHMAEYALLATLLLYALAKERGDARKWISSAWVLATAYAATDELHQRFIPGRNGCVTDVFIDSAGAALGLLGCFLVLRAWNAEEEPFAAEIPDGPPAPPFPARPPAAVSPASPPPPPPPSPEYSARPPRPTFADQILCTLQGDDFENRAPVRLTVQDRLQREHGGRLILGRGSAAQLCIKNTSISGRHLALIFRNGQFEIEDLNSSNGTRINGRKIAPLQPVAIADGDRIEAGEVLLHFRRLA